DSLVERAQVWTSQRMEHILICCVCLGDNSEDTDEIIQCDNCGVTVHEGSRPHSEPRDNTAYKEAESFLQRIKKSFRIDEEKTQERMREIKGF
ncbi:PHD finger protein 14, partial [Tachysurus ichikawai]